MTKHICDKCGKELNSNTPFCPNCGAAVFHSDWDTPAPPPPAPPADARPEQDMTQPQAETFPMIPKSRKWIPYAAAAIAAMIGLILSWDALTALFSPAQDPQLSSGPSSSVAPSSTSATTPTEPDEIQYFQSLLTARPYVGPKNFYNIATLQYFSDPKELNWKNLLYNGIYASTNYVLTEEELAHFNSIDPLLANKDANRMGSAELNTTLHTYFGITLNDIDEKGKQDLLYWDTTDSYYTFSSDVQWNDYITVIKIKEKGGTIQVFYKTKYREVENCVMTLKLGNGVYRILSNLPADIPIPPLPDEIMGVRLSKEALDPYKELLSVSSNGIEQNFFNMATLTVFDCPENVNLYWLFSSGIFDPPSTMTAEEKAHFADKLAEHTPGQYYRFTPEEMDDVLTRYFGITLEESNKVGLDRFEYWEKTGCYYLLTAPYFRNNSSNISIGFGELIAPDTIRLCYYAPGAYQDAGFSEYKTTYDWYITLQYTSKGVRILSNVSGKNRPDDPSVIPPVPSAEPGSALTKEELGQFQLMFTNCSGPEQNFFQQALACLFSDVRDIDLSCLFYNGISRELNELTEEERAHFGANAEPYVLPPERMDAVLAKYFNTSLEESHKNGLDNFQYWEKTGRYYWNPGDAFGIVDLRVIGGEVLPADTVRIDYISINHQTPQSVTLQFVENRWIVLSNLPITPISEPIPVKDSDEIDEECAKIATKAYFTQRLAFLRGESDQLPMAYELITPDLAKHREAIQAKSCTLLFSYVSVYKVNSWELAEVYATETCGYLINGQYKIFVIDHYLLISRTSSNLPVVWSDGYWDTAVNFKSSSYIPNELRYG